MRKCHKILRPAAGTEEMDHEENKREDKKNVDKSGRYMENDERADPGKEQQKREHQEYKAHHEPPADLTRVARRGAFPAT